MRLRTTTLVLFICALVACSGGQLMPASNGNPSASTDSARSAQLSPALAELAARFPQIADQLKPLSTNPFACTAPAQKVPGTYASIIAYDGAVKGKVFASKPGELTVWLLGKYIKATPAPTPSPGTTPTPKTTPTPIVTAPPGQPLYFYIGSYKLKKYGQGCAFLITSVNGKTIKKQDGNALAFGVPTFKVNATLVGSTIQEGPLSMRIGNLSAHGGSGSVALLNAAGHGKDLDTGTVVLTNRIEVKF
ncbi:MAG TPA: hypothetical protein VK760_07995 [Candidatus Acidoferrales bacterium]|jgi:hypothetical protein|nr:hypothetical protein [Candidatus Acidoferrales bacterium]